MQSRRRFFASYFRLWRESVFSRVALLRISWPWISADTHSTLFELFVSSFAGEAISCVSCGGLMSLSVSLNSSCSSCSRESLFSQHKVRQHTKDRRVSPHVVFICGRFLQKTRKLKNPCPGSIQQTNRSSTRTCIPHILIKNKLKRPIP